MNREQASFVYYLKSLMVNSQTPSGKDIFSSFRLFIFSKKEISATLSELNSTFRIVNDVRFFSGLKSSIAFLSKSSTSRDRNLSNRSISLMLLPVR